MGLLRLLHVQLEHVIFIIAHNYLIVELVSHNNLANRPCSFESTAHHRFTCSLVAQERNVYNFSTARYMKR